MNAREVEVRLAYAHSARKCDLLFALMMAGYEPCMPGYVPCHGKTLCVVSDDPEYITTMASQGVDAVVWDTPDNRGFSWHLRATSVDDAIQAVNRIATQIAERELERT